jgi:uncharacterized protein (TIGR04255 family)
MRATENPLLGKAPAEVPLKAPPLIRVVAQVRFPMLTSIRSERAIAPFQEQLRKEYPFLRPEEAHSVTFGPGGPQEASTLKYWRFHDQPNAWTVTLGPDFIALETTSYGSRTDFLDRFFRVLQACQETFQPAGADRLGIRYINQVTGPNLTDLHELLRPEVLGIVGTTLAEQAEHMVAQNVFLLPEGKGSLAARWGLIPAGRTVDPSAIDPIDEPSWVLDLDAYNTNASDFEVDRLVSEAKFFSQRLYAFFRWAVSPEFLRRYGGRA